ncbi:glycine N-acyltransferase-like [Osmerus mordax]|uniref:glycine N-acyltransferase-like n=1 Tax=Osmerus mordax TaxID=8014 RepID=UPI003510D124
MIILKAVKELSVLRNILYKDLTQSVTVLGGVLHILHNNPCHLELCVDSWPIFSTVICYRRKQAIINCLPDICTIFTLSPDTLRTMLLETRIVNWKNGLTFRGRGTPYLIPVKKHPLKISSLDVSHAELVDRHLPYGGTQESVSIHHLPNVCVTQDREQPVSWMLSDELCELRMAYTFPEYRRSGHLMALSAALMRKVCAMGLPVYCHVNRENHPSMTAVTSLSGVP